MENGESIVLKPNVRLHLSLIGMNRGGYRINGGAGFAIQYPTLEVVGKVSDEFRVTDQRRYPINDDESKRLKDILTSVTEHLGLSNPVHLFVRGTAPTHMGFGTGTAIRLAAIEILYLLNNHKGNRLEIVQSSGRGRTSGIGVNTYFEGGLVVDIGHLSPDDNHLPSSQVESIERQALLLRQVPMPEWQIGILIPSNIVPKTEIEEKEFFISTCPIPSEQTYITLYHVIYGLLASVLELDFSTFCMSIRHLQECYWKSAEWNLYGKEIKVLRDQLYLNGASAVGMSSLGPSLYFFSNNINEVVSKLRGNIEGDIFVTSFSNSGRDCFSA